MPVPKFIYSLNIYFIHLEADYGYQQLFQVSEINKIVGKMLISIGDLPLIY